MFYKNRYLYYGIIGIASVMISIFICLAVYQELVTTYQDQSFYAKVSKEKQELNKNKIFPNYAYVFQAPYVDSKDFKLPMINLNGEVAIQKNQEIKKMYETLLQEKKNLKEMGYNIISNYQYTVHGYILSILIYIQHRNPDKSIYSYLTYNFYLSDQSIASYETIYQKASISNFNIDLKVKNAIHEWVDSKTEIKQSEKNEYANYIFEQYQKELKQNTLLYYLDENDKLNIMIPIVAPNQKEEGYQLFTI